MATVVVAETAREDLDVLILTRSLPSATRDRVGASLAPLAEFPLLGPALTGRWHGLRFILGPWPWMILVYEFDESADRVTVVTIQDSRSARSVLVAARARVRATSSRLPAARIVRYRDADRK